MRRREWCVALALATCGIAARPAHALPQFGIGVQPRTWTSPSGEFELFVDPMDRLGEGPARYRLLRGDEELWSREHPVTLIEVAVADNGSVAGYAHTRESFRVIGLSHAGELVLDHSTPWMGSRSPDGPRRPHALGLFRDPGSDRFVVRLTDTGKSHFEEWWQYRLSSSERQSVVQPEKLREPLEGPEHGWRRRSIEDAAYLSGTPLRLIWWWHSARASEWSRTGEFTLIDEEGRQLWALMLERDYDLDGDAEALAAHHEWIRARGGFFDLAGGERFSIRRFAEGLRVDLEARRLEVEPGWEVVELATRASRPAPLPAEEPTPELPLLELALIDEVCLGGEPVAGGDAALDLGSIEAFGFGDGGSFRIVRQGAEPGTFVLIRLAPDGELLSQVSCGPFDSALPPAWWPLRKGRWLAGREFGNKTGRLWFVDEESGSATPLPGGWRSPAESSDFVQRVGFIGRNSEDEEPPPDDWTCSIEDVSATGDSGFVALVTFRHPYTLTKAVLRMDTAGRQVWSIEEGEHTDPTKLFHPEAVGVATSGVIAVADMIQNSIQVFDANGGFLHVLELTSVLGQKPNYPTGLVRDPKHGLLLYDFDGSPPLYRLSTTGEVAARITITPEEGRPLGRMDDFARIAPDGEMWTTDGDALYRVGPDGALVEVIGDPPQPETLSSIAAAGFDRQGRILLRDGKTNVLHGFDSRGNTLFHTSALTGDFRSYGSREIFVDESDGTIFAQVGRDGRFIEYDPGGNRRGPAMFSGERLAFTFAGSHWVEFRERGTYELRHVVGEKAFARIERAPNGRWLFALAFGVDPENDLLVLHGQGGQGGETEIAIFGPDGEHKRSISDLAGLHGDRLLAGERWILITHHGRPRLVNRSTGKAYRLPTPFEDGPKQSWVTGLSPDGEEYWVVGSEGPTLYRYELP